MSPEYLLPRFLIVACAILGLAASSPAVDDQLYTCGMHPQVIRREPGNCPICGMALTPVRKNIPAARTLKYYQSSMNPGEVSPRPGKDSMGMDMVAVYDEPDSGAADVHIDRTTVQRMNLRTAQVQAGPVIREFRTVGTVAFDETAYRDVTLRYDAWVESVHGAATGAVVREGEPLLEVYSPDLTNADLNLIGARRAEGDAGGPLTRAALARLDLLSVPPEVSLRTMRGDKAPATHVISAPGSGIVVERAVNPGQMVRAGDRLFRLAGLSTVWIEAQVVEQDLPFVHPGSRATVRVTYGPERSIDGTVALVLPQVQEETRSAIARIVLPNPDGTLRPGMFVDVRFATQVSASSVLVPDLAVLRSGEHTTVFVDRGNGSFEPREVSLGLRSQGNLYQVLGGLAVGERVVTSGQFMLDSESQLRDAIQKMLVSSGSGSTEAREPSAPPTVGMDSALLLPEDAHPLLLGLALAAAEGAQALGRDDLAGYQTSLPGINKALSGFLAGYGRAAQGPMGAFRAGLARRADIAAARLDFARFSTAVADLVRENHLHHENGLHIFQCPMAPGIGNGRWISTRATLLNPFYGAAMPGCGEEIDPAPAGEPASRN